MHIKLLTHFFVVTVRELQILRRPCGKSCQICESFVLYKNYIQGSSMLSHTELMRSIPNSSYTPLVKAQCVTLCNKTVSIKTIRENIVLDIKELHHLTVRYFIGCETSNCEEFLKIEMALVNPQIPANYPNCFELLYISPKKIFTTSTNRSPDISKHNSKNSKNHNPHFSEQDQSGRTVKATWPSSARAVCYVLPTTRTIRHQFLTTDRILWWICISRLLNCEQQKCNISGARKSSISTETQST